MTQISSNLGQLFNCYSKMFWMWVVVIGNFLSGWCNSAPVSKYPQIPSTEVLTFMKRFGYIEEDDGNSEALYTEEGLTDIIKTVQKFGGIEETGRIDNATIKLLKAPRCGVPDIIRPTRTKRFVLGPNGSGWQRRNITYFLANWNPLLGEDTVMKNIQKALDTWGGYGRLTFHRVYDPNADIIVGFGSGYHGDLYPFDGRGIILAHAFFPYENSELGGDIHFDNDEMWVDKAQNSSLEGTDFYTVALHELGHSLGLAHTPVPDAVMYPYYKGYDGNSEPQLSYDDILGMYNLYISRVLKEDNPSTPDNREDRDDREREGARTTSTTNWGWDPSTFTRYVSSTTEYTPTYSDYPEYSVPEDDDLSSRSSTTMTFEGDNEDVEIHKKHDRQHNIPETNSPSLPNICDGHVDAVATLRNQLFVFRDQFIWRFVDKGILERGYPVPIFEMFPKLPRDIKKIDAAYQRPDGLIVIFTGSQFWVYNGIKFVENSPRPLTDYGLPEYVTDLDAVQNWDRNRKTYFYKKERFWRYNEQTKTMDSGYPLSMERWRGVPDNLDSALTWKDGLTYFFKGPLFWKFDNEWVSVTDESPFPTAQIWFGCEEEPNTMLKLFSS